MFSSTKAPVGHVTTPDTLPKVCTDSVDNFVIKLPASWLSH